MATIQSRLPHDMLFAAGREPATHDSALAGRLRECLVRADQDLGGV